MSLNLDYYNYDVLLKKTNDEIEKLLEIAKKHKDTLANKIDLTKEEKETLDLLIKYIKSLQIILVNKSQNQNVSFDTFLDNTDKAVDIILKKY